MPGHPYLIYEYRPGRHEERGVTIQINSLGLRGPELPTPKPQAERRLLVTGDSSIFGFGVPEGSTLAEVAAERLGARPVNAGLPGYSTLQTKNLLSLRAWAAAPDLVVIGNLWSDNTFDRFVDKEVIASLRAWDRGPTGALWRLLQRSAVFRLADWALRVAPKAERVRTVTWTADRAPSGRMGRRRVEINDYQANLYAIADAAIARGAGVAFLMLPNRDDLAPAPEARPPAWAPYRAVLREAAAAYAAPLIDGPALFAADGRGPEALFIDEMHPTIAGHAILGEGLAEGLAAVGWPGRALAHPRPPAPPARADPYVTEAP